jgi:hypothetical protein
VHDHLNRALAPSSARINHSPTASASSTANPANGHDRCRLTRTHDLLLYFADHPRPTAIDAGGLRQAED